MTLRFARVAFFYLLEVIYIYIYYAAFLRTTSFASLVILKDEIYWGPKAY